MENTDPQAHGLWADEFDLSFRVDFPESHAECVALDQDGTRAVTGSLSDIWKGFGDKFAVKQLASLSQSAVPFTIAFKTTGRDPILRQMKAHLQLVPPYDGAALAWEPLIPPLREGATLTILVLATWLGLAAPRR